MENKENSLVKCMLHILIRESYYVSTLAMLNSFHNIVSK